MVGVPASILAVHTLMFRFHGPLSNMLLLLGRQVSRADIGHTAVIKVRSTWSCARKARLTAVKGSCRSLMKQDRNEISAAFCKVYAKQQCSRYPELISVLSK